MNSQNNMGDNHSDGDVITPGSVSRSGRVRKKNSFLDDYESPDIIEKRKRRGEKPIKAVKVAKNIRITGPRSHIKNHVYTGKASHYQHNIYQNSDSYGSMDMEAYDDVPDIAGEEIVDESLLEDDDDASNSFNKLKSQKTSTYMLEKSFLKQRKFTGPTPGTKVKATRKDKGTSRVTAYMLWTKSQATHGRSIMDLRDLWASLPVSQKKMWKTKAAKIMKKKVNGAGNMKNSGGPTSFAAVPLRKQVPILAQRKGLMKNTTPQEVYMPKRPPGRPPKNPQMLLPVTPTPTPTLVPVIPGPSSSQFKTSHVNSNNSVSSKATSSTASLQLVAVETQEKYQFKVIDGTSPLDVAARLSLLGEQMNKIATEIKSKKEPPTTGCLSVLLDSLLCSIPALLSLTKQVPELDCIPETKLKSILNNTDYIMPGI